MRYYRIDELPKDELDKISAALDGLDMRGGLAGVYYLPVPNDYLTDDQREHMADCGPYLMALEVELPPEADDGYVQLELLVRAKSRLRCGCMCYADEALRQHMMSYLDTLLTELDISS